MGFWGFGVLGFWGFGVLGFWGFGVLGFWAFGLLGFWAFGLLGFWAFGLLGFWALWFRADFETPKTSMDLRLLRASSHFWVPTRVNTVDTSSAAMAKVRQDLRGERAGFRVYLEALYK